MAETNEQILADIRKIQQIAIVPTMLEVICRATGMGFAAIIRVTEDRWIACSVRDEIGFGVQEGGELKLETTICNEVRESRQAVLIDHVAEDSHFCNHHTPKIYGFQSYISLPIVLNTGEVFGTLCALDPAPHKVSDIKIAGMFSLFAELIAFHLQALDMLEFTQEKIRATSNQLNKVKEENERYEHLTYHSLREPVRKISLFSDILLQANENSDPEKLKLAAVNINRFSHELANMLRQLNNGI